MSREELQEAGDLQRSLFPADGAHEVAGYRVYVATRATSECTGDWWTVEPLGSDALIALGDVTGHGSAAALLTALSLGALHAAVLGLGDSLTPNVALTVLNEVVTQRAQRRRLVTGLALRLHAHGVTLCNAGHPPPWLVGPERVQVTESPGDPPLGAYLGKAFHPIEIELDDGEILLCFTDGAVESMSPSGQRMGERGLREICDRVRSAGGTAHHLVHAIIEQLEAYRGDAPFSDDVTVVAVQRAV